MTVRLMLFEQTMDMRNIRSASDPEAGTLEAYDKGNSRQTLDTWQRQKPYISNAGR